MGNSNASAFLSQFSTVELRESTKKQLWQVYHCTYGSEKEGSALTASAPAAATIGIDSPPASPRGGSAPTATASSSADTPFGSSSSTTGDGRTQRKQGQAAVVLQLNTQHPSYRASTMPPKVLNPTDHQSSSQYKLQYNMLETSHRALQWLRDHPHRALLRVTHVDYLPEEKALYCTTPYISLEPILLRIPSMCAVEILYGLTKIAEALAHLHSNGLAHRCVSWRSVYFAYTLGSLANFPDASWILAEPQFTSLAQAHQALTAPDAADRFMDYLTELRGVRQDPSSLAYCAPELNNPFVASQIGWSKISGSAADVFSFGVMLDTVINNDRTRFPSGGVAFVNPFANAASFGPRPALEELRRFAKQCQHDDPLQRPAIEHFLDLGLVQGCTYVHIQQFLDHYRTSGWLQRVHFFYLLHVELLKLPYDLMVSRVMPRLLRSSLWNDSCAEPFVRQLLVPVGFPQQQAKDRRSSTTTSKDEAAMGEPALMVPLKPHEMKALGVRQDDAERAAVFGEVDAVLASLEAPETSTAAQLSKVLIPRLPCYGVLQLAEFQSLVGAFLRKTLEGLLLPHSSSSSVSNPAAARGGGETAMPSAANATGGGGGAGGDVGAAAVAAARSGENPYISCLLLRNVESYAPALSFTQFVLPLLIPFVGQSLEHMEADVVLEALRAFQYLHRHVFSTYDRYVAHNAGRAAYMAAQAAAATSGAANGGGAAGAVVPPVHYDPASSASGSATVGEGSRDAAMRGTLEMATSRLVAMLNQQVFSRACCDAVPEIRLGALMLATKSITSPPSKADRYMPRSLALAAICSNVTLANLPVTPLVAATQTPRRGCDALVIRDLQVPFVRIALRCVAFMEKVLRLLTPAELVQELFPSLTILYDRLCTADATPREKELLDTLATTTLSLMDLILAHLRDGSAHVSGTNPVSRAPPAAAESNEGGGEDEGDDEPLVEDGGGEEGPVADLRVGRLPFVVDKDGWCVVRDPPPLIVPSLKAAWQCVVPRASPPAFRRRSLPRQPPSAIGAKAIAASSSPKAAKEGGAVPEAVPGEDKRSDEPSIGIWTPLHIPASCVASLPTFSFLDFDHDYNTLAVVRPDRVAAEVISASSSRAFVCSIKPHALAFRLPSRRGVSAPAVDSRESPETSDHAAVHGKPKAAREHKRVALEELDLGSGHTDGSSSSMTGPPPPTIKATEEADEVSRTMASSTQSDLQQKTVGASACDNERSAPLQNPGEQAPAAAALEASARTQPLTEDATLTEQHSIGVVASPLEGTGATPESDASHTAGVSVTNRLRSGSAKAKVGEVTPPPVPRRKTTKAGHHGSGSSAVVVDDDL